MILPKLHPRPSTNRLILSLVSLVVSGPHLQADILAGYPFENLPPGGISSPAQDTNPSVDTDSFTVASPLSPNSGFASFNNHAPAGDPIDRGIGGNDATPTARRFRRENGFASGTLANAFINGDFMRFTLTPEPGAAMTIQTFSFTTQLLITDIATFTGNDEYAIFTSIDGFVSTADVVASGAITAYSGASQWQQVSVDLSSRAGYADLTAPVEFRVYWYGTAGNSDKYTVVDNVMVEGTSTGEPPDPPDPPIPGGAPVLNRVRFMPAPGFAAQMQGGVFAGSNQGETFGFTTLATISQVPAEGVMTELTFSQATPYRYVIYEGPHGSRGIVAEVEFYQGTERLAGEPFGVAGRYTANGGGGFEQALDGNGATFFEAPIINGAYVGLDLGTAATMAATPVISPDGGSYDDTQMITITAEAEATVRYTTDGTLPTRTYGTVYAGPLAVGEGVTVIRAIAYHAARFNSELADAIFLIGPDAVLREVSSYHIGNSLTDTFVNGGLANVAASAGYQPKVYKCTIPGAPTDWLWNNPDTGFGVALPSGTNTRNVNVAFPEVAPLMHLTTQPFSAHGRSLANEAEYSGNFFALARQASPNVQFWVYSQWPGYDFDDSFSTGQPLRNVGLDAPVAATWEEGALNHMRYFEELRRLIDEAHGGRTVGIIPTAHALIRLKRAQERGEIPGLDPNRFREDHWSDEGQNIHCSQRGAYFVSLVVFSTIYGVPTDHVNLPESSTGVTPEQDPHYRRIAWEAVRNYRWALLPHWENFNTWREEKLGFFHATEGYDWNSDTDGDRMNLLMEYAVGGHPAMADRLNWHPLAAPAGHLSPIVFPALRDDPLYRVVVRSSPNLAAGSWVNAVSTGATVEGAPAAGQPGFTEWTVTPPVGAGVYFLQLAIEVEE